MRRNPGQAAAWGVFFLLLICLAIFALWQINGRESGLQVRLPSDVVMRFVGNILEKGEGTAREFSGLVVVNMVEYTFTIPWGSEGLIVIFAPTHEVPDEEAYAQYLIEVEAVIKKRVLRRLRRRLIKRIRKQS